MMKLGYLPVAGALLVASLTVAACGSGQVSHYAAAASTTRASSTTSPVTTEAFAKALAAWKLAANAPSATMNEYLLRAADDLRASGRSSYRVAIDDLMYLASLPETNDTAAQQAKARKDVQALDSFFGTPSLLS